MPSYFSDEDKNLEKFRSISVGSGVTWACTDSGKVLVRWNTTKENPLGDSWEIVCTDWGFNKVVVWDTCVWAIRHDGLLVVRKGFSEDERCGTHWCLENGMKLKDKATREPKVRLFKFLK